MRLTEDGRITKNAFAGVAAVVVVLGVIGALLATRDSGDSVRTESSGDARSSTTSTTTTSSTTSTTTSSTATTEPPPPPTTAAPPAAVIAPTTPPPTPTTPPPTPATRCVVRLHGKGGSGAATTTSSGGWLDVNPQGNASGWGGAQWLYFPAGSYASALAIVDRAISDNGCAVAAVIGFSNGGAFAAKMACRGETLGGRVVGYVVDDPVPDHGTDSCGPAVPVALYWTGGLASTARPGWACAQGDWTCEGGETIGIEATAANLGVPVKASIHNSHSPYQNPPELRTWLG